MKGDVYNNLTALFSGTGANESITQRDQAVTASAVSRNSIDLLAAKDISPGKKVRLDVIVTVAVTRAAGAATVNFEIIQADDAGLTNDIIVIGQSGPIDKTDLTAGCQAIVVEANPVFPTGDGTPALTNTGRRFLGCRFTVSNALDTGSFVAQMNPEMILDPKLYPSGWNAVGT